MSPNRKRPRPSPPPPLRRPPYERTRRSYSPRSPSNSRPRPYSPVRRRPHDRRRHTPTPISSSRGYTPPKSGFSPRKVKVEPSTDTLPSFSSNPVHPAPDDTNTSAPVGDQPPVPPRGPTDRQHHRPPSLDLSLGKRATATSTSPQPFSPREAPLSPIFAPETPIIPGLSASVQLTQPQITAISALQKSLGLVIKDQGTNQTMKSSSTPPAGSTSTAHPTTTSDVEEKTDTWTTRVKCVESAGFVKVITLLLTLSLKNFCVGYGQT